MTNNNTYRLGLDLGTNSIGWAMLALNENNEPHKIIDAGVRIFSDGRDPQSKEPLAVARRIARGARRRRDRFLARKEKLMNYLIKIGLMPEDELERKKLELLNPYKLRTKALDQALQPYELGRAIFHLNQRRGFKSNRKEIVKEEGIKKSKTIGDQNLLKQISLLQVKKHRISQNSFVVEGEKSILEFIDAHYLPINLLVTEDYLLSIFKNAILIKKEEMKKISSLVNPSPALAVFEIPKPQNIKNNKIILALDQMILEILAQLYVFVIGLGLKMYFALKILPMFIILK